MTVDRNNPVAIGGVGGSGTRIVAEIIERLGFHMGEDLNESNDNLWFTLLFKRRSLLHAADFKSELELFTDLMTTNRRLKRAERVLLKKAAVEERLQHKKDWLLKRVKSAKRRKGPAEGAKGWGWKEPNTHVFLEAIMPLYSQLRYVHVIRHGLDMAFSGNQNQFKMWRDTYGVEGDDDNVMPSDLLHYWCLANKRAMERGRMLGDRFLLLSFDDLCRIPEVVVPQLAGFTGVAVAAEEMEALVALPRSPASLGRYRGHDINQFSDDDLAVVKELGFEV